MKLGLFGKNNQEKAQEVEIEIMTNNSWLADKPTPKAIVRNIPNGGQEHTFEYFKARGCDTIYPCIQIKDCIKIVEKDQTFEIHKKIIGFFIVPKAQVMEIQFFK